MKILIVDDEALARARLRSIIEELEVGEVIGEASNGRQTLEMADQMNPDVLLLDIRMPGMDGLETASHLAMLEEPPAIIFTTAYDEYALQAFESHAVDYLLKPIRRERLADALRSARRLNRAQLQTLNIVNEVPRARTHISARISGKILLIPVEDIRYFQADRKYVTVRSAEKEVLIEDSLKTLEEEFNGAFIRIHRNALIAANYLTALEKNKEGHSLVRLQGIDETLEVSRRHLASLRKKMKGRK